MSNLKKLTLLHSNDMHGDFTAEKVDNKLLGGVSLLSGYIQQVRAREENVLYAISGDMFCGSLVDTAFRGVSTIEIMNMLTPDVATLGNHEVDYGVAHLLFLEKCARFPIINANMYIKSSHTRLFRSHVVRKIDGMNILFIGVLTEEVLQKTKKEELVGTLVDVREAAEEVGKICDTYRTEDIDLTVLLTHIGFEADQKLAAMLNPAWGVDLIIGGHTHTLLEEPCVVAGIPIVQAATGTDQIGRFDLVIDTDRNAIDSYTWQLIPIDDSHCPRDMALEEVLARYQQETEEKYSRYITRFADSYTHPRRDRETELGKLFADIFKDRLGLDLMFLGSGSLRKEKMGPIVDYRSLTEMFPYEEEVIRVWMTGEQLERAIRYIFRPEALAAGAHSEHFQYSRGLHFVCSLQEQKVSEILFDGKPVEKDRLYKVGFQKFHYLNTGEFIGVSTEELEANGKSKVVSTTTTGLLDEWLSNQELVKEDLTPRWITRE